MSRWPCLLACVAWLLVGCESSDSRVRGGGEVGAPLVAVDADASTEDLYFEMVRLHSAGVLPPGRMDLLHEALDWADREYGGTAEHAEQERNVVVSLLRRTLTELHAAQEPSVVGAEGRAYARRLNQTGVREAQHHAEGLVLIAGMVGVPTGKEDLVLMVAIPVGGYVVVKVGGMALKRAAFLLRRARTVDDVVEQARGLGLRPRYAATEVELREVAGPKAAEALGRAEPHVGAGDSKTAVQDNRWNPSGRRDNCTACVTAVIHNSMKGYFEHSADDIERVFRYAGRERRFTLEASLRYIEEATGLKASRQGVPVLAPNAPVGHYAIFTRWDGRQYHHVVYGRVTPTGRVVVFDPQSMERMSYQDLLKRHGKARPHLLEAP